MLEELTQAQKSIWLTEKYYQGTNVNTICGTAIIEEKVDFEKLEEAIKILCQKYDNFKLRLKIVNGEVKQELSEEMDFKIDIINVANLQELEKEREKIIKKPFQIENSKLFQFYIFKFDNGKGAFALNIHHIISDAWTLALACKKIIQIYSNLKQNQKIETKTIYSYMDYINSEKEYMKSEKFQKDKKYWEEKFEKIPEVAIIPGSKNGTENDIKGNRKQFTIDKKIIEKVKKYCKENSISLFNFFMAIYGIYISEISNLDEFVIGTPILNRTNFKEKDTLGMFINTAPLKINLDGVEDFKTFVKNIAIDSLNMLKHQKYSYQTILEGLREKDKSIPNLYNILLSYQITDTTLKEENIKYRTEWTFNGYCPDNIQIHIYDLNDTDNLDIAYDYRTSIYDEKDIEQLHNRIAYIVRQVIAEENIKIKDIEIVTLEEKEQLVIEFNKTELEYDKAKPIIKYFEEQVEKTPNEIAMVFGNKQLSYKELNEKANSLAYKLREEGVTNDSIVGIMKERSFEIIIAILAVLKVGGSYIPIAPDYPDDRIEYMLKDSSAKVVLVGKEQLSRIKEGQKTINIDLSNEEIYSKNKENIENISKPEDLSYLIYTSGSTGIPKGVMLKQQNLSNFYNAMKRTIKYLNDKKHHKIISITTLSFDIFGFETLMSLTRGLTLYMTNENEQKITSKLEKIIKENGIEIIQTTPSVMKFHLDNIQDIKDLSSLKYVILAGEQLPKTLVEKLKASIPDVTIYNGYGPSETTIFSTITDVTNLEKVTIGRPIANTQIYILNKNKKVVPQGTIGEIYIAGDGVGRGYMNKKEQTEKSYLKNPFRENSIMYKSGDLGSFDSKGKITCYGRIDNQVKINGLRIELAEIEKQILSIYNILDCVVIKKHINNRALLCAYYTQKGPVEETVIKTVLKSKLPQYMLPQYFIRIEKMPHTPNGKIDKKLLPEPNLQESNKEIVKVRNKIDEELIKIIKKMLYVEQISLSDTLLDLGGDSLTAITLSTKILSKFNVQVNIKDILSNYTIKDISDFINDNRTKNNTKIKIEKAPKQDVYPLSTAQKRIYYNSKMIGEENIVYNLPGAIAVDEILDKEKVKKIFEKIIERHEILRTSFRIENDNVMQKIEEKIEFDILTYNNKQEEEQKLMQDFSKPFNLEKAPLLRVELHYIDNKKTLMLLETHHIIMDGIALNNLIIEFNRIYNGENLKKIPIQYKDYAVWENKYNESENVKKYEQYWVNKFKDSEFSQLNLPYDYKMSANRSYKGNKVIKVIEEHKFKKIERYAKKIGVSPYILFISAFFVLLYKYTGQEEIILGSPFVNRNMNETKRMIGMFVNNIVVKGNIRTGATFQEFLNEIKEQVLDDLSNQPYPFDSLVKKLGVTGDNSRNPLFDIMFTYQNKEENIIKLHEKEVQTIEINNNIAKFNLSLEIKPKTHSINIEYSTDLFKEITIKSIFEHYMSILEQIMNKINIKINDIDMITENEEKILDEFNSTEGEINNDTTAFLIEQQVKKNPNNIAVICEDKSITYGELDKKANSLANHLIKRGIKNNDIVCIMTNRSIETIVAMYAILKAGGAFLNIDPTYPIDRTKYYIENSKAQYVLVQRKLKETVREIPNCIEIDLENNPIYDSNFEKPQVDIKMDDLSYIIYTSGSTGVPKGVMLEQVGLTNMAKAMTKALDYLHDGKIHTLLSVTSTPFDIFVYEIIVSLTHGQRIVMANNAEHRNPKLLEKLIKKYNTDVMTVTPSLMKIIYDNREKETSLGLVKNMVFGGEPLPEKFVKDLKALADDITVFNIYGPSEITILSNVQNLNGETEITTGPPIMNTQIHILDKNLNRVPIGVVGEIYISGIQVGKGYLGKPELTNEKFLPNKFGKGKMYKSGDIGRWTFEGKVQCLGRIDHQIKLRGLRIELGEIESKMEQYPGISAAVVNKVNVEDKESLCGYYVTEEQAKVEEAEVKSYLRKYLPQYMVPSYIVHLEKMPYTINRKIDRKALPLPNVNEEKFKESDPNKFDKAELKLLQIWKNILHIKNISLEDNFFDIGGDSISAIKMQIEALKYGFDFEYADIFKYPTIKELAGKRKTEIEENISEYDYSKINKVLEMNQIENLKTIKKYQVKNILLIGSTGYLGVHILNEFLQKEKGKIYCLVRRKDNKLPIVRLQQKIAFYFGNDYFEKYQDRIQVIEGDIVKRNLGLSREDNELLKNTITTVINAGAIVKHFGTPKLFNEINVTGTQNIVNYCKRERKRLIHISTISVSGNGEKEENIEETEENINNKKIFKENTLYIEQNISGIYTTTKYKAEMIVLNAISNGLDAQILRMGNITNRFSDGVFQQNVEENAFAKRLKSFIEIGAFPEYLLQHAIELGPVDLCAEAVVKILEYNSKCNVLHLYNSNLLEIKLLITTLNELGIKLQGINDEMMAKTITEILENDDRKEILSGIINDIDSNKKLVYTSNVRIDSEFSKKYLEKIGFSWKNIDKEYILKYMDYFKRIKFINY